MRRLTRRGPLREDFESRSGLVGTCCYRRDAARQRIHVARQAAKERSVCCPSRGSGGETGRSVVPPATVGTQAAMPVTLGDTLHVAVPGSSPAEAADGGAVHQCIHASRDGMCCGSRDCGATKYVAAHEVAEQRNVLPLTKWRSNECCRSRSGGATKCVAAHDVAEQRGGLWRPSFEGALRLDLTVVAFHTRSK